MYNVKEKIIDSSPSDHPVVWWSYERNTLESVTIVQRQWRLGSSHNILEQMCTMYIVPVKRGNAPPDQPVCYVPKPEKQPEYYKRQTTYMCVQGKAAGRSQNTLVMGNVGLWWGVARIL